MSSLSKSVDCYEIWLYVPGECPELLNECGSYRSHEAAGAVRDAVRDWFRLGRWVDAVLDRLPPDVCSDLFARRQGFKARGIDLDAALVTIHRTRAEGLRIAFTAPDEDEDADEDTPLEPVDVVYDNALGAA